MESRVAMMQENSGILAVISGFSGSGKGTVIRELMKRHPESYALSISATTRSPREGEEDGREYFFKTRDEFEQMIRDGALIEHAEYVGNYYGTPRAFVEERLAAGVDVILEIEVAGALSVRRDYPDSVLIFVAPPSAGELKRRLIGRGTESMDVIDERMRRALEESRIMDRYDYIAINDVVGDCAESLHSLIQGEHRKSSRNAGAIRAMQEGLAGFQSGKEQGA